MKRYLRIHKAKTKVICYMCRETIKKGDNIYFAGMRGRELAYWESKKCLPFCKQCFEEIEESELSSKLNV